MTNRGCAQLLAWECNIYRIPLPSAAEVLTVVNKYNKGYSHKDNQSDFFVETSQKRKGGHIVGGGKASTTIALSICLCNTKSCTTPKYLHEPVRHKSNTFHALLYILSLYSVLYMVIMSTFFTIYHFTYKSLFLHPFRHAAVSVPSQHHHHHQS